MNVEWARDKSGCLRSAAAGGKIHRKGQGPPVIGLFLYRLQAAACSGTLALGPPRRARPARPTRP